MTQQWIRSISLTVDGAGGPLDLSNMRVHFEVKQDTIQTPNAAIIRIYNLARPTVAKLLSATDGRVFLEAGYQGNRGGIFSGQIKQVKAGRASPTDTFCDIYAADGDHGYNGGVVSKTLSAGSTMLDHVHVMADAMAPFGVTLGYVPTDLLQQIKYPRAVTFFGMAKDYLRTIAHTIGATWSIQDGTLMIVELGKSLGGVRELNSTTGLIGMPIQTRDAIEARCLIDPKIGPYSQVRINQGDIQPAAYDLAYTAQDKTQKALPDITADGIYTVCVVNKVGDTHDQPWYMDIMCIAQGHAIPTGSSLINYPATAGIAGGYDPTTTPFIPQEAG